MLIVCEGQKTEVNYFDAIRREKRIPSADIEVVPSNLGTSPMQVVDYAERRFLERRSFDKVYMVFDRDEHASYHQALEKAASITGRYKNDNGARVPFCAIPSVPSFELWLLLHFRNVPEFMGRDDVNAALILPAHYPAYAKNSQTAYADTQADIGTATGRAEALRLQYTSYAGDEPYTDADVLTNKMIKLGNRFD